MSLRRMAAIISEHCSFSLKYDSMNYKSFGIELYIKSNGLKANVLDLHLVSIDGHHFSHYTKFCQVLVFFSLILFTLHFVLSFTKS
jgi:hypothetical protein